LKEQLIQIIMAQSPAIVAGIKALFKEKHPDLPEPTSEEVIAAELEVFGKSVIVDDAWLAAHPDWNK